MRDTCQVLVAGLLVCASVLSTLWLYKLIFELVVQRDMTGEDWAQTFYSIVVLPFIAVVVHSVGYRTLTGRWPR